MTHILVVAWLTVQTYPTCAAGCSTVKPSSAVTMQEFSTLRHCQYASVEIQKLAPGVKVLCLEKGDGK